MPIMIIPPQPFPTFSSQPYYIPQPQQFTVETERFRHNQAMYSFGEYAMFALMWTIEDFDQGLVPRCQKCFVNFGEIAAAFKQPSLNKCTECFGTTFSGGFRALIVRPTIWVPSTDEYTPDRKGMLLLNHAQVQSTDDFRANRNDYVFKADGSRWKINSLQIDSLTTGMEPTTDLRNMVGFTYGCDREDETSVAYMIGPPPDVLSYRLQHASGTFGGPNT